jgi:hypothetical protein
MVPEAQVIGHDGTGDEFLFVGRLLMSDEPALRPPNRLAPRLQQPRSHRVPDRWPPIGSIERKKVAATPLVESEMT